MVSPTDIINKKGKEKIVMMTCYTYTEGLILQEIDDIDIVLVGDSAGMLIFGHRSTIPTSIEEMELLVLGVSRAINGKFMIVADMPFGSYQVGEIEAVKNAVRFMKAGANAIKLEGGREYENVIRALLQAGIPVMGHLGLMPQSINVYPMPQRGKNIRNRIPS
jgi:3-methyl-2-oxobutanoate hydroxymethyltransferase